jgi:hypothetical protein
MAKMNREGYDQGNMSPKVESYQRPSGSLAGNQPGKTVDYIARQNAMVNKEASDVRKQDYKGRYQ